MVHPKLSHSKMFTMAIFNQIPKQIISLKALLNIYIYQDSDIHDIYRQTMLTI